MQGKFHRYKLTADLTKKYYHSTYLASPTNEPERQVVLMVFASSLFSSLHERDAMLQKAQCIKELQHEHLLPILDMGTEGEQVFIVRDYLPNESLRCRLKQLSPQRLELHDAFTIILQVGEALAYAHQHNILHGNLKPENILFDVDGQAVLTDFALINKTDAIIRDQIADEYAFCYMAPEQFSGICNAHSDQYAMGCIIYEMIAGQVPFANRALTSMMGQHNTIQPVRLSEKMVNLPLSLDAAILKTLAKDPDERFFDFSLFLEVIRSALSPPPAFPLSRSAAAYKLRASSSSTKRERESLNTPLLGQEKSDSSPISYKEILQSDIFTFDTIKTVENDANVLLLTDPFGEQESNELSATTLASPAYGQRGFEIDEMILSLPEDTGRYRPLMRQTWRNRRKSLGLILLCVVIVAFGTYAALSPSITNKHNTSPHPIQAMTQLVIPSAYRNASPTQLAMSASLTATVQPTSQTTPTPQTMSASLTATVRPTSQTTPTPQVILTPTPNVLQTVTIDDSIQGTGSNQFNYVGSGWLHCQNCGGELYSSSNSWDGATNDYVTVSFTGIQLRFYGVLDSRQGIGAVSIDSGSETMIDFYAATRAGNHLLWTSPTLPARTHTFKLRVTGSKNTQSANINIVADRVDIIS